MDSTKCAIHKCGVGTKIGTSIYCEKHDTDICIADGCDEQRLPHSVYCPKDSPIQLSIYDQYKKLELGIRKYVGHIELLKDLPKEEISQIVETTGQVVKLRNKHLYGFKKEYRCEGHIERIAKLTEFNKKAVKYVCNKFCGYDILPCTSHCTYHHLKKKGKCKLHKCNANRKEPDYHQEEGRIDSLVYCDVHETNVCAANDCGRIRFIGNIHCINHVHYFFELFRNYELLLASVQLYLDDVKLLNGLSIDDLDEIFSSVNKLMELRKQICLEAFNELPVDKKTKLLDSFMDTISNAMYPKLKLVPIDEDVEYPFRIISNDIYWRQRIEVDYPSVQCETTNSELMYTFLQNKNFFNIPDIYNTANEPDIISALSIFNRDDWREIYFKFEEQTYCSQILSLAQILNYPLVGAYVKEYFCEKFYCPVKIYKEYIDKLTQKVFFANYHHVMEMWASGEKLYFPFILVEIDDVELIRKFIDAVMDKETMIRYIAQESIVADKLDIWLLMCELSSEPDKLDGVLFSREFTWHLYGLVKNRQCRCEILLYSLIDRPVMLNYFLEKHKFNLASGLLGKTIELQERDMVEKITKYGFYDYYFSDSPIHLAEPSVIKIVVETNDVELYRKLINVILNPVYDAFLQMLVEMDVSDEIFGITLDFLIDRGFHHEYLAELSKCDLFNLVN